MLDAGLDLVPPPVPALEPAADLDRLRAMHGLTRRTSLDHPETLSRVRGEHLGIVAHPTSIADRDPHEKDPGTGTGRVAPELSELGTRPSSNRLLIRAGPGEGGTGDMGRDNHAGEMPVRFSAFLLFDGRAGHGDGSLAVDRHCGDARVVGGVP